MFDVFLFFSADQLVDIENCVLGVPSRLTASPMSRHPNYYTSQVLDARLHDLFARVEVLDETDVQASTKQSADERADDRDPEVEAASREHLPAPASEEGKEARAEVTGWVKSVARVKSKGHANAGQHQSNRSRERVGAGGLVELVTDSEDAAEKQRRADNFVDEAGPVGDLLIRVGRKDALCGGALRVLDVEPRVVHHEHHPGRGEGAQGLGNEVTGELVPFKSAECSEGQRDRRVEVATAHAAGKVDAEQQSDTPGQIHGQVVASIAATEHILRDGPVTDEHQDEGADELGQVGADIGVANGVEWQTRVALEVGVSRLERSVLGHSCFGGVGWEALRELCPVGGKLENEVKV
ncbi:hypothetical protein ON010_g14039 [Phytophthora cinnamomi]|nr:hypothetical protein ON010_g14039 [Phytophthora cinnamomi]